MAKLIHLGSYFLTGCIASSMLAWVGFLHPVFHIPVVSVYLICGILWLLGWLTDDAVAAWLKIPLTDYYAVLIALFVAIALGGVLSWLIG